MLSNAESIAAGPTHKNPQYCGTGTARCVKRRKSFATRSGRSMGSWKTCRRRTSSHGWPARQRECRGWSRQSCQRSGSHRMRRLRSRCGNTADRCAHHGASEIKEYTRGISRWARQASVDLVGIMIDSMLSEDFAPSTAHTQQKNIPFSHISDLLP